MWEKIAQMTEGFTQENLYKRYQLAKQVLDLSRNGWSQQSIQNLLPHLGLEPMKVGTEAFLILWDYESCYRSSREILTCLVAFIGLPEDLSGNLEENQRLVNRFSSDLDPASAFWKDLSQKVDTAFPEKTLSEDGSLEKKIHQLRYVISAQQAHYVRQHYKRSGDNDAQALANYLATLSQRFKISPYQARTSARFHNKLNRSAKGLALYPDAVATVNIKILVHWHTEYILDQEGNFLNEVDDYSVSLRGIVNGASFNYGKGDRHWDLDVDPVGPHDPIFRKKASRPFRSANLSKSSQSDGYDYSYFNPIGFYASNGQSQYACAQTEAKGFEKMVKNAQRSHSLLSKVFKYLRI